MRGLKYLFTVPEGEKITEAHLTRVLVSSICSILLCMSCLVSTTWAWFAVSVENTGNVITVGTYAINTTVTNLADGSEIQPTALYQHAYYLPEGEYAVKIALQEDSVSGYCEIYVNNERMGTLVLDQVALALEQSAETVLHIKVNEAIPVSNMTGDGEVSPNLVVVPTWGRTLNDDILMSDLIEIGEEGIDRTFAVIMNNAEESLPMVGINQADLFFEMLIEGNSTRGLAMFSDVFDMNAIGSIRSVRYNFTDLAQAYGAILIHASGSDPVIQDMNAASIDNLNVDGTIGYRDSSHSDIFEHTLFVNGQVLENVADAADFDFTAQKGSGLRYAAAGNTATGEAAAQIEIGFSYGEVKKTTTMVYNNGVYEFHQYGRQMVDGADDSVVSFANVIVLQTETVMDDIYYVAQLTGNGTGYFAWGGQIVPIQWSRANDNDAFTFTLTDGSPVILGEGSTYIAITNVDSPVNVQ